MQGLADGYFILPYTIGDLSCEYKVGKGGLLDFPFKQNEQQIHELTQRNC